MVTEASLAERAVTIVDDEPAALDVLARAAHAFRFDCQTAGSAEAAMSLLEQRLTPLVVTDLRMPGRGGFWLVQQVQKRWPDVDIIVVTAGVEDECLTRCLQAGVKHYFLKPIRLDEFHHALQSTWEAQMLRRERVRYQQLLELTVKRRTGQLKRTFLSAINSLVRTLEARDAYTSGHSRRVRDLSVRLADRLGLDAKSQRRISLAARLHDIGKVGLPEGILKKAAPLTVAERAQVREHPATGERILSPIIRDRHVLAAIRGHHERFDGTGYPDRLAGEEIPLLARVITVADCFDALTSNRAYRAALSVEAALDALTGSMGTQFDPQLVPPFVELVRSERLCNSHVG